MSPDFAQPPSDRPADRSVDASAEATTDAAGSRWKKKELPSGLWLKCESCAATIYRKELEEKGRVCPACDFHFTLPGRERIKLVLDPESFDERFADLGAMDRLRFNDSTPYADKIKRTESKTGQKEALLCGFGSIEGLKIVIAVLDFSFLGGSTG